MRVSHSRVSPFLRGTREGISKSIYIDLKVTTAQNQPLCSSTGMGQSYLVHPTIIDLFITALLSLSPCSAQTANFAQLLPLAPSVSCSMLIIVKHQNTHSPLPSKMLRTSYFI